MKRFNSTAILVAMFALLTSSIVFAQSFPKKADNLVQKHAELWKNAVNHPFLEEVQAGKLSMEAFSTWLAQDYLYVHNLLSFQGMMLVRAPRADHGLLIGGLAAIDSELAWFEANAKKFNIDLSRPELPTCRAYSDFMLALSYQPYVAQITTLWALEKAYYDSWKNALPCEPKFKEFVDRWTNEGFKGYVDALEAAADAALKTATPEERAIAEKYFEWVARYERDFWQMAYTGK
ncbi:MAG: TenA family transcriptional regulator [Desulfobacteraceae bacterium]|nr:TenA family transcriptional regulator [Desulfobacteraceae bacterium]